jgi:hypothetical protein
MWIFEKHFREKSPKVAKLFLKNPKLSGNVSYTLGMVA